MRKFGIIAVSLVIGLVFARLLLSVGPTQVWADAPVVNPDLRVSPAADADPHDEPSIAVSPLNTDVLVAASKVIVGGGVTPTLGVSRVAYYYSSDGGQTWGTGLIPLETPQATYDFTSDPTIAVDTNGSFYLCVLMGSSSSSGKNDNGVYVYKSTDNGHTFGPAIDAFSSVGITDPKQVILVDKPFVTVDTEPTSPFEDSVYVAWVEIDPVTGIEPNGGINVAHMRPNESEFSSKIMISHFGHMLGPQLAIGPNGEVYGIWQGVGLNSLLFDASTDGGATFDSAIGMEPNHDFLAVRLTGPFNDSGPSPVVVPGVSPRMNSFPSIAVDRSNGPNRGRIYLAWTEVRDDPNCDVFVESFAPPTGSAPVPGPIIKASPSGANQFFPELAVDPATGAVYLAFYDQTGGDGLTMAPYITESTDGGATFGDRLQVSSARSNPRVQQNVIGARNDNIGIGDYIGLNFFDGSARLVWTDTRNNKQEIFYDRVVFAPGSVGTGGQGNDACSSPKAITSLPFTDSLDTTTATSDPSDPANCSGSAGSNTVWYSLTAASDTVYGVDTSGSSYDTTVGVFTGSCDALSQVSCNDDFGNSLGNRSLLTFEAHAGTTYLIEASGKGSGGELHLRVGFPTVSSIAFTRGPDGTKSLKLTGAGFVVNNARVTLTINGADIVLPNNFFTGATLADGTTTTMFANQTKLKKIVKRGVPVVVTVESPVGSGSFSVPLTFTR